MIVIKTSLSHRHNQTVNLAGYPITFDSEGKSQIDVEGDIKEIEEILSKYGISIEGEVEGSAGQQFVGDKAPQKEPEVDTSDISKMTAAQLKSICQEAGFPEDEWRDLTKKELLAYIDQLSSQE